MKAKVYACVAEGLEEVECLAAVDVMIRSGIDVKLISMSGQPVVTGSHGIKIVTDMLWEDSQPGEADCIFLPGGMPGTKHLAEHKGLAEALEQALGEDRRVAAICAAPSVLGGLGFLRGKKATCYPGFEDSLAGAEYTNQGVITDGLITTARGLGYALDLGLELSRLLVGQETAAKVKASIQYDQV
ncbi:MAG: DJ-1/PfpI family protein [Lachnospiraceae bacterium]|nr:DJ-1/PfpI family protein [Lachnospiraceae bacterium]